MNRLNSNHRIHILLAAGLFALLLSGCAGLFGGGGGGSAGTADDTADNSAEEDDTRIESGVRLQGRLAGLVAPSRLPNNVDTASLGSAVTNVAASFPRRTSWRCRHRKRLHPTAAGSSRTPVVGPNAELLPKAVIAVQYSALRRLSIQWLVVSCVISGTCARFVRPFPYSAGDPSIRPSTILQCVRRGESRSLSARPKLLRNAKSQRREAIL